ncbi:hypothetical protein ACH4TP_10365 [Streptomyces sp. NPDC021012]
MTRSPAPAPTVVGSCRSRPLGADADDYVLGANVAGFLKVAEAMQAQGVI